MRAVDTNVIVRLAVRDDQTQTAAAEAYIAKAGAWVSHLVLVEVTWVLASVYELDRTQIALAVELLLQQKHLFLEAPEVVGAALALYRGSGGPDFADCMIVELARKAGHLPVGTFDRKFAKLAGAEKV
jgi:predicted nucleic-acid-binding protein